MTEGLSGVSQQPQPAAQKDIEAINSYLTIILNRSKDDIIKND